MPRLINHGPAHAFQRPDPALPPSLPVMAKNYAVSTAKHVLAGCPRRSEAEVAQIIERHCRVCPEFLAAEERCAKCGCPLRKKGRARPGALPAATLVN